MNYWEGSMNWALDENWKCEICETRSGLEWGMVHAQCRCNNCGTNYRMRDKEDNVVTVPICSLKPQYFKPWKEIYIRLKCRIDEVADSEWERVEKELEGYEKLIGGIKVEDGVDWPKVDEGEEGK